MIFESVSRFDLRKKIKTANSTTQTLVLGINYYCCSQVISYFFTEDFVNRIVIRLS